VTIRQEISVARSRANVKRRLKAIYEQSRAEMQAVFEAEADRLTAMQRRFVPVDQGDTLASIRTAAAEGGKIGVKVIAGSRKAFQAPWIEFGTIKMAAQPFFFPPYRILRPSIKRAVRKGQKKAIKKALSR